MKDIAINLLDQDLPTFQPQVMQDIFDWAKHQATGLIFIYGQQDIFTGGRYPLKTDEARDNQMHVQPGLHGIRINDLPDDGQQQIKSALQRWLN